MPKTRILGTLLYANLAQQAADRYNSRHSTSFATIQHRTAADISPITIARDVWDIVLEYDDPPKWCHTCNGNMFECICAPSTENEID